MPKDVIGTAYVRVVALSQDFEKQVQQSFNRLKPIAEKGGKDNAQSYMDGWDKGVKDRMQAGQRKAFEDMHVQAATAGDDGGAVYGDRFGDSSRSTMVDGHGHTLDDLNKESGAAGSIGGNEYGTNWRDEVVRTMGVSINDSQNLWRNSKLMRFTLADLEGLAKDMPNILGDAAKKSGDRVDMDFGNRFINIFDRIAQKADLVFDGIGASIGDIFKGRDGGGGGKFFHFLTDGAEAASSSLLKLITVGEVLGSAMVGLVAGIANVVSGLFAIVSAAGEAGPALAVIPGLLAAIAQAGATILVGFKGVGKAISEGLKQADTSAASATARANALAAAQRGVANASRAVQTAEQSALRAKKELADAQKNLNDAYKEGAKQLRDIQYAAEDAALQEERSALNLADARDNLLKVKATNPADSRAVQEAELQYKEADLAYREARSRNKDASEEANDATKKGVKGTQAVVSAQDRLVRAQEGVISSNQRLADAQLALADAQKKLADTQSGSVNGVNKYKEALAKFGPEGQKFIKKIVSMKSQLKGFKEAAGEGTFKALNGQLSKLAAGPFFGMLKKNLALTSTAVGGVVTQFGNMVQESGNLKSIDRIMKSNTVVIKAAGSVATSLGQAFISITDAARPMTQEFAKWIAKVSAGWAATLKADNASGALTKKFAKAAGVAKQLGRIIANVAGALHSTGKAASDGGHVILDAIEKMTKKWNDWTKTVGGQSQLKGYFDRVAKGFVPLVEGVNAVVKAIALLGGNVNTVTAIGDALKAVASVIGPIGAQVETAAPFFSDFTKQLARIFKVLQDSGSLEYFAKVMTAVAKGIADVITWFAQLAPLGEGDSPLQKIFNGKNIIFFVGAVFGVIRALKLLKGGFSFLTKATIGNAVLNIIKSFKGLKRVFSGKSIFSSVTKSSEEVREEFKKQMLVDRLKKQALAKVGEGADIATEALGKVDKASRKSRIFKAAKAVVKAPVKGVAAVARSARSASGEDLNTAAGGAGPKAALQARLAQAQARRTRAALDAQRRTTLRSRASALVRDRVSKARGNEGGFIGRSSKAQDDEDTPKTRRSSRLAGATRKVGGATRRVAGAAKGGISKLLGGGGLIGSAIGAVKLISGLNTKSAGELGDTITGMLKNIPTALTAIAGQVPKVITAIVGAIGPVLDSIVKALPGILATVAKALPKLVNTIGAALPKVFGALVKIIPVILQALANLLPVIINLLAKALPILIDTLAKLFPKVIDVLVKLFPKVLNAIVAAFPKVIGAIVKLFPVIIKALAKAIPLVIKAIAKALPLVIKAIVGAIPLIIGAIVLALPDVIKAIAEALPLIIDAVLSAIPEIINAIISAVPQIVTAIAQAVPLIWEALQELLPAFSQIFTEILPKILSQLGALFSALLVWIGQNGPKLLAKLGEWAGAFLGWILPLLPKIPIELAKIWLKVAGWIVQQIPKIATKIMEWTASFLGWIGGVVSQIPAKLGAIWTAISTWIGGLPGKIATAASGVWSGMFEGIKSSFMSALNWVIDRWNEMRFPSIEILGRSTPDRLPHIERIKLATGGVVMAQAGGVAATLAEGGRNEVVKPLDARGLTASDRLITTMMKAQQAQLDTLVRSLMGTNRTQVAPTLITTATTAAIAATQHAVSASRGFGPSETEMVASAIEHLTASVDALQKPLVGGNLNVVSAPNEFAAESVPRALRRRAYTKGGAR